MDNIFFDKNLLRACGDNVIIGKTVRIRYPELVEIGDNTIIDDFTYISTQLKIERNVHIAAGCKLIGGPDSIVEFKEFSTLAPNVVLAAGSDDYISGIASPLVPSAYKGNVHIGAIKLCRHCVVGANSTILPDVTMHDGAAVGSHSLVKSDVPRWSLYAGIPAKYISFRNKKEILRLEAMWREENP